MKNFFETFLASMILTFITLTVVMLVALQTSIVTAREIHDQCWNAVETSEIANERDVVDLENKLNEAIHKNHSSWNLSIETLTSNNLRPYYLVTLDYAIQVPIINIDVKSKIQSYAQ